METMRQYELAVLIHPDLEIDLGPTRTKLDGLITQLGGKIASQDDWGKHKLAYPIAKQEFGIYNFYQIELEPAKVAELEEGLGLANEVLRYLLVKPLPIKPERPTKAKPPTAKAVTKPLEPGNKSTATLSVKKANLKPTHSAVNRKSGVTNAKPVKLAAKAPTVNNRDQTKTIKKADTKIAKESVK